MDQKKLTIVLAITFVALGLSSAWAVEDKSESAVTQSLARVQKNIQLITENLSSVDQSVRVGEKNLGMLEAELNKKRLSHQELKNSIAKTENAIGEINKSDEDFQDSLRKDLELIESVQEDIDSTKKRLGQLQENIHMLQDNVDIDRENIEKVAKVRESSEKNLKSYRISETEMDRATRELEKQIRLQKETVSKSSVEMKRWQKLLEARKKDLEKLESSLKTSPNES